MTDHVPAVLDPEVGFVGGDALQATFWHARHVEAA